MERDVSEAVEALKTLEVQDRFRQRLQWLGSVQELVEAHRALSPFVRRGLAGHAEVLRGLLARDGLSEDGPELRELACLVPGRNRGKSGTLQRIWLEEDGRPSRHLDEAARWWRSALALVAEYRALGEVERSRLLSAAGEAPPPVEDAVAILLAVEHVVARLPPDLGARQVAAFRTLSPEGGRQLAWYALGLAGKEAPDGGDLAETLLHCLACLVPGALAGLHGVLVRRGVLHPGELFRGADAEARDLLLRRLEEGVGGAWLEVQRLLIALAWVGDAEVQRAFTRWRALAPPWAQSMLVPPGSLTEAAGWELTPTGGRRELCREEAWRLVPAGEAREAGAGPVQVVVPHEAACEWCGRPLVTLLALELGSPALAFLGLGGGRLRIAMCERCTLYAPTYTDVDLGGGSRWSRFNVQHAPLGPGDEVPPLPQRRLVLGPQRRTPVEANALVHFRLEEGASQLGGHPTWVQDVEYPACPACRRSMPFLGQVELSDLEEFAEGTTYAFLCVGCGVAAVTYQQT